MYYFRFALVISRHHRKIKKKGEDVTRRVQNEVFMYPFEPLIYRNNPFYRALRTHVSHLQASIKDEAKDLIKKFMIDRYKIQKLRAAMRSFYNRSNFSRLQ